MSIEIRLGGYDTINFQNVGDKYIAEYLFGEYYDGERNLVSLIGRTDVEQSNIEQFYNVLKEKFYEIIDKNISELVSSNLYLKKKNILSPVKDRKMIDLERVNVSINQLDNSQLIGELSGLSNLSPELLSVAGKSKIPELNMEEFEELFEREENNLERKLFKGIADNIEVIDTNTSIIIRCNLINFKMQLLREAGITMLRIGKPKKQTKKGKITIDDIYGDPSFSAGGDEDLFILDAKNEKGWSSILDRDKRYIPNRSALIDMKSFYDPRNLPRQRGKGTAEKIGTDNDVKLFFINLYRDSLGDVLNAQNLTLEMPKKAKSFNDDYGNATATIEPVLEIEQKQLYLTDKPLLEGDNLEDSPSRLYGSKSEQRAENYPLPPHLIFGNPRKDSKGNTRFYSNSGSDKQAIQDFFMSLNRRKNRLERAIDSLGDDI